jgi:predicted phage terminase large subunit-like protein
MNDPSGMIVWGIFSDEATAQANRTIDANGRPVYIDRTYNEGTPHVMLMHAWTDRYEFHQLVEKVVKTAVALKVDLLLIENKAAGISIAQEIRRLYSNEKFGVQLFDPRSQDKFARLVSVQHLFSEGLIYAPDRKWADAVITQVGQFPRGKHDEYVDLTSMGLRHLRDTGLITRAPERLAELESLRTYPGRQNEPLYPV